jgi:precorrin-6B methylase 2
MGIIHKIKLNYFWYLVDFLSFFFNRFGLIYEKIIGIEYEKEIKKFGLSNSKKVLHIGCGAYPITAIILAKTTSADVVSIDKNPMVVKLAQKVIKKKKLQKKVKIDIGNGEEYSVKKYDTIIISSCSSPKNRILNNIFNNTKLNTKIIIREIQKNLDNIKDIINSNKDVKLIEKIKNFSIPNLKWYSFYLIKKN